MKVFNVLLWFVFLIPGGLLASRHRLTIPFEEKDGAIILTVKINGYQKPLRLLFDTGADGMAVSQELADSIGLKVTRNQHASVVGGYMDIQVSDGNTVHLDTFVFQNQGIAIFPEMHRGTDGIIGNTLARHYVIQVNYDRKELSLYDFSGFTYPADGFKIPITMEQGNIGIMATLSVTAGQPAEGNFYFDTGAGYHLMVFRPFVKEHRLLVNGFKQDSVSSTMSMGMATTVFHGKAASFAFAGQKIEQMPVALMGGSAANAQWQPGVAGSIGVGLISQFNFIINLRDKCIHFVPNKLGRP